MFPRVVLFWMALTILCIARGKALAQAPPSAASVPFGGDFTVVNVNAAMGRAANFLQAVNVQAPLDFTRGSNFALGIVTPGGVVAVGVRQPNPKVQVVHYLVPGVNNPNVLKPGGPLAIIPLGNGVTLVLHYDQQVPKAILNYQFIFAGVPVPDPDAVEVKFANTSKVVLYVEVYVNNQVGRDRSIFIQKQFIAQIKPAFIKPRPEGGVGVVCKLEGGGQEDLILWHPQKDELYKFRVYEKDPRAPGGLATLLQGTLDEKGKLADGAKFNWGKLKE